MWYNTFLLLKFEENIHWTWQKQWAKHHYGLSGMNYLLYGQDAIVTADMERSLERIPAITLGMQSKHFWSHWLMLTFLV